MALRVVLCCMTRPGAGDYEEKERQRMLAFTQSMGMDRSVTDQFEEKRRVLGPQRGPAEVSRADLRL